MFNEEKYYKMIAETLSKDGSGMSTLKLAESMKINVALMKEHIKVAEERGFVCKDESYEGI
jgi:Mn-dependent DtxR family transcriptional regulator